MPLGVECRLQAMNPTLGHWVLYIMGVAEICMKGPLRWIIREGFAKVSQWYRKNRFSRQRFGVTQLPRYGCHHHTWPMPDLEIQDCNITFCESFAKVPHELSESRGWDLKGRARSHSLFLNYLTFILTVSLSLFLILTLSIFYYLTL